MKELNKYQKFVLIICLLPFLAWATAYLTKDLRYSEYRSIYLIGVLICYLCWSTAFIGGLINSILILQLKELKLKTKLIWTIGSLLPILYMLIMMLPVILNDPLKDDIVLPSGETISGEYKDEYYKDTIR